jgi:hypothetical protein
LKVATIRPSTLLGWFSLLQRRFKRLLFQTRTLRLVRESRAAAECLCAFGIVSNHTGSGDAT